MPGWIDEGVKLRLYVSKSGDFVSLGERTEYPFTPGGSGIPAGMSLYAPQGGTGTINFTTSSLGRFSISNGSTTDNGAGKFFGATLSVPYEAGYRYVMSVQAQVMEGKATTNRDANQSNGSSSWGTNLPAVSPWEDIAFYGNFESASGTMTLRVAAWRNDATEMNWGVQFQNLALTKVPQNPPVPTWEEVTCEVRSLSTKHGRERASSRYEVASASVGILNDGGEFTYRPVHPWGLRPGRFIKVEAEYAGGTYPAFYGIIDGFADSYTLDGHALMVMNCIDASSLLSNMTVPGMSDPATIVKSGTRFSQVLNGVGWHPQMSSVMLGQFGQQGITANGRTVRDELGLIAESEGGYFFADRTGLLIYRDRNWEDQNNTYVQAELMAEPEPEITHSSAVTFEFPDVTGNFMDTPDPTAAANALNDVEITARVSIKNWSLNGAIVAKYGGGGNAWRLDQSGTTVQRRFFLWGGGANLTANADVPYAAGEVFWVRARYVKSTGQATFWHAADSPTEPTAWTQLGTPVQGPTTGQAASTANISVGQLSPPSTSAFGGRIAAVKVRGDGGALLFEMSEEDAYDKPGTLAFTAKSGHPMTVHQTSTYVIVKDASSSTGMPVVDDIPTAADAPIVCTNQLATSWDRARIVNEVSLANQRGSAITQVNTASQKKYGPYTYQRMDLLNDNAHPEYIALRMDDLMTGNDEAVLRVNSVGLRPKGSNAVKWALRTFLHDLVRVRYSHPLEGWGFSVVAHVQGIEHTMSLTDWTMTLALDQQEAFTYYVEGSTESGWDIGLWDEDIWDGAGTADTPAFWNAGYKWSTPNAKWG